MGARNSLPPAIFPCKSFSGFDSPSCRQIAVPQSSVLAPFRNPVFRSLWAATLFSNLGTLVQATAAGWMMAGLTAAPSMVALVQSSNTLPFMVLSLVAGALADSFNRRKIMIAAQIFVVVVSVMLAGLAWYGLVTPWMLLVFTFLIASGGVIFLPSWQASMGDILAREDLSAAVSLNGMSYNMMRSVGPAVGGAIVASFGAAAAFALNALSCLPLIGVLLRWQPEQPVSSLPPESLGSALGAGLRYALLSPALMRVMLRGGVFGFSAICVLALLPLVARDLLHGTALTYGILLGAFGLGAIGGVSLNGQLGARFSNEMILRISFIGFAVGVLALAFSPSLVLSCLALMLMGPFWVLALSLFTVSVQLSTPRWVVGRALSMYQTTAFGGMAAGAWFWGAMADVWGGTIALCMAAAMLVAGAILGIWMRQTDFEDIDLTPIGNFVAPQPSLNIKQRSGPIMILVEYDIGDENTTEFLALMRERRKIRIRDGARQWSLMRDLEKPDRWLESYHVPTWNEYLRHNHRRTRNDAKNFDKLLLLHRGPSDLRVHRLIERQTVPLHDDFRPHVTSGTTILP